LLPFFLADRYLFYLFLEQGFSRITGSINRIDVYNKCKQAWQMFEEVRRQKLEM